MNEISDSAVIAALRRQMTVAVATQVASAGNLANVDTPGYQTKEVTFDETLASQAASSGATNAQAHCARQGDGHQGRAKRRTSQRAATATTCSSIASC